MPKLTQPENITPINLNCISQPMTEDYAQNLWYIVSGAIECGGLGGESWGWTANPKEKGWKDYNEAGVKSYQTKKGIPYMELLINAKMREENDDSLTEYQPITCYWLHDKVVAFVNDSENPEWLRKMYAEMLVTREHPTEADAVSDDAVMQYGFLKEIRFG